MEPKFEDKSWELWLKTLPVKCCLSQNYSSSSSTGVFGYKRIISWLAFEHIGICAHSILTFNQAKKTDCQPGSLAHCGLVYAGS